MKVTFHDVSALYVKDVQNESKALEQNSLNVEEINEW
jgi:hypothetical protein